jgi:PKD repeat protein
MKKQLSKIALGLTLVTFSAVAQENYQFCNTYAAMEQYWAQNPGEKQRYDADLKKYQESIRLNHNTGAKSAAFQYTIPIVFHILHTGGSENVSDASVIAALATINDDYAATTPDYNSIAMPFKNYYINSDIKFVLATKDPSGNGTTGIIHSYDARTEWAQSQPSNYNGITWNATKYLNIIVVKNIISNGPISGGQVGGYTYRPGTFGCGANSDAVVVRSSFISQGQVRGISHEIGHWLNLGHTFGNTNNPGTVCGDDDLDNFGSAFDDTPPTKGNYNGCPSSQSGNSCAAATTYYSAGQQNTENIMDYSTCPKNFTTGQTNVMRATLAGGQSCRPNLWTPANLSATGADGNGPAPGSFPPVAEFLSANDSYTVCAGGSLTMQDFSYNGTITSYLWSGDNGAVAATSNSANTIMTFPNVGVTQVTLTVSNSGGASSKVRNVYVLDGTASLVGPNMESFENENVPPNWSVINSNGGSAAWAQTWSAGFDGVGSFMIDGSQAGGNQTDILQTAIYDLASVPDAKMTFALSYAQKSTTHSDVLKVQASKDCGATWFDVTSSFGGNQMQANSGGISAASFTPTVPEEWKIITISDYAGWTSIKDESSVIFRFNFTEAAAGAGNNLFIDAINLFSVPVGISELYKNFKFQVFPNPTTGEATIKFNLNDAANVRTEVFNLIGQEVVPATESKLDAGEHAIHINEAATLSSGMYLVNVSINGAKICTRLVVN